MGGHRAADGPADDPYRARFLGRARPRPGRTDATLLVERDRFVGSGMREDLVLRNLGTEPAGVAVTLAFDADFADVFEVKEDASVVGTRRGARDGRRHPPDPAAADSERSVLAADGAIPSERQLSWRIVVPAHGEWRTTVQVQASVDGDRSADPLSSGVPLEQRTPSAGCALAHSAPQVVTAMWASPLPCGAARGSGALRIHDPEHPEIDVVAAGAPWFMTLFGRDSLLTPGWRCPWTSRSLSGRCRRWLAIQGTAATR